MNLDERLKKLEIELARAKRSLAVVLLVVVLVAFVPLAFVLLRTPKTAGVTIREDIVNAKQFNLLDDSGKLRAVLSTNKDEPELDLLDADGKNRVVLGMSKDVPGLMLFDADGKNRVCLQVPNVGRGLVLWDPNGKVVWEAPPE